MDTGREQRQLKEIIAEMKKRYSDNKAAIAKLPAGHLRMEVSNGSRRYYQVYYDAYGVRKRKGITRNKKGIAMLVRKEYLEREQSLLEENIRVLEKSLSSMKDTSFLAIIKSMPKHFDGIPFKDFLDDESWK